MNTNKEDQSNDQREEGEIDSSGHDQDPPILLSSQKLKPNNFQATPQPPPAVLSNSKLIPPPPSQNKNHKSQKVPDVLPPPPPILDMQPAVVRSLDKKLQSMKTLFMQMSQGELRRKLEHVKSHRLHHLALNEKMVRASCLLKEHQSVKLGMKHDLTIVQDGSDGEVSDDNQMIVDLENHESKVLNERNDGPTLIDVQRVIIDPKRIKRLDRIESLPQEEQSSPGVVLTGINQDQRVDDLVASLARIEQRERVELDWRKVQRFQEDGFFCAFIEFFNVKSAQALFNSFKRNPNVYRNNKGQQILAQYAYDSIRLEPWVAIILRNFHPNTKQQVLMAQFKNYKRVLDIQHIRNYNCGVIVMHSIEEAEAACIAKNGIQIAPGKKLKVHVHPESWRTHSRPHSLKVLQAQDELYLMQEKQKYLASLQPPAPSVSQTILQRFGRPPTVGRNRTSEQLQERKEQVPPPITKVEVREQAAPAPEQPDKRQEIKVENGGGGQKESVQKGFYQDYLQEQERSYKPHRNGYYSRDYYQREGGRDYQREYYERGNYYGGHYREGGNYREYRTNYERGYRNRYYEGQEQYQGRRHFNRGYKEQYDRKREYGKMRENPAQAGPYFHSNH